MKILLLTLVLALMLIRAPALKCNNCFPGAGEKCKAVPEECPGRAACISSEYKKPPYTVIKRCITRPACAYFQGYTNYQVNCCYTDFCN